MNRLFSIGQPLRIAIVVGGLTACGGSDITCVALPCAMPVALTIALTSASSGGPVSNAVVQFTGPFIGTAPCVGSCIVPGYAGTYNLDISAPGFQTVQRTVTVTGSVPGPCDCGKANTVHLDVALVAGS
jgi:hypothetical protein